LASAWAESFPLSTRRAESRSRSEGRTLRGDPCFGSGHLLFICIDDRYEAALDAASDHLSQRYPMDFRGPARKYAALGRPEDVAETVDSFRRAGVRHLIVDPVCRAEARDEQLERFAREVRPLLRG